MRVHLPVIHDPTLVVTDWLWDDNGLASEELERNRVADSQWCLKRYALQIDTPQRLVITTP